MPRRDRLTAPVTIAPSTSAIVPPQNLEAEESVLGAMLLSATAIGAVTEVLQAGDFYRDSHGTIYQAALALYGKGEPVDAITLANELEVERLPAHAGGAEDRHLVGAQLSDSHGDCVTHE